jgi:hypothetical protein
LSYSEGHLQEAEDVSLDIIRKIENKMPGYEATSGRYAAFFLGYIYKFKHHDYSKAKDYFNRAIAYAQATEATESGYYLYSLQYLAQMAEEEKNIMTAKQYYERIKDDADSDHECYKLAKQKLKEFKKRK